MIKFVKGYAKDFERNINDVFANLPDGKIVGSVASYAAPAGQMFYAAIEYDGGAIGDGENNGSDDKKSNRKSEKPA